MASKVQSLLPGASDTCRGPAAESGGPVAGRDRGEVALGRGFSHHAGWDAGRGDDQPWLRHPTLKSWMQPAATDRAGAHRIPWSRMVRCAMKNASSRYTATFRRVGGGTSRHYPNPDAGGDKPIPGYTVAGTRFEPRSSACEGCGCRLRHPDVFRIQLRSAARAAALGHLKVIAADA